jgi:hypothetical protein
MSSKIKSTQNNIKQFTIANESNLWKKIDESTVTLKDESKDILIENNIIVRGTIQNPSDINLKYNIEDISKTEYDQLSLLNPITYIYKDDMSEKTHYGLIAQNVEQLYPNLVRDDLFYNYKSVNYIEFIPILIAKINYLEKEIEHLKLK